MSLNALAQHLAAHGEGEDKILAHINPEEAQHLAEYFGYDINPHTGLPQFGFFKKIKKAVKKVAKPIKDVATGHLGAAVRDTGNLAQSAAPLASLLPGLGPVASGLLGAGGSLLSGDSLKQALGSGLNGALGGLAIGGLGALGSNLLGAGTLGNYLGSLGQDSLLSGALGGLLGSGFSTVGIPDGGFQIGNTVYDAAGNIIGEQGSTGGLFNLGGLLGGSGGASGQNLLGSLLGGGQTGAGGLNLGGLGGLAAGGVLGALLASQGGSSGHGEGVQKDVLSDAQKAYFNRPSQKVDFDQLRGDASASGKGLTDYVSSNWDKFMGGAYNKPPASPLAAAATPTPAPVTPAAETAPAAPVAAPPATQGVAVGEPNPAAPAPTAQVAPKPLAQAIGPDRNSPFYQFLQKYQQPVSAPISNPARSPGPFRLYADGGGVRGALGALSQVSRYAQGGGSGRDDAIDAKLSDGEYVMDAESVAMLGDGSNKEGARRLDRMREEIRKQKGRALAKGRISPNAKNPMNYLKAGAK